MKRTNPDLSEGLNGSVWERLLADVRGHMFAFGAWDKLAAKANVSVSTVQNLAYGNTKSPHFLTVLKIMAALDRLDEIVLAFASEHPVFAKEAKRLQPKPKRRKK